MDDRHEPDTAELCVRGGCGFVAGGAAACLFLVTKLAPHSGAFWGAVLACAVVFALLAMYFGDDAWYVMLRATYWLWPW